MDNIIEEIERALEAINKETQVTDRTIQSYLTEPEAHLLHNATRWLERLLDKNKIMLDALKEIKKCEGAYSRNELTHARNTIRNLLSIADVTIAKLRNKNEY